jgi:hypothetical protein
MSEHYGLFLDRVKVLGAGPEGDRLEQMVLEGQRVLGLPQAVDRITHPVKLAVYGAYAMPALVFGRQVVLYGRVPAFEEVLSLLEMDKNRQY